MKNPFWAAFVLAFVAVGLLISCGGRSSSSKSMVGDDDTAVVDDDDDDDDDATPGDDDDDDNDDASPDDDATCDVNNCPGCCDAGGDCQPVSVCWTDPATGYTWQNGATVGSTPFLFAEAQTYCNGLTLAGYNDWKLPEIDQLRSLIRDCAATVTGGPCGVTDSCADSTCWSDVCNGCVLPPQGGSFWPPEITGNDGGGYWSSSTVADWDVAAWYVEFDFAYITWGLFSDPRFGDGPLLGHGGARCVRP